MSTRVSGSFAAADGAGRDLGQNRLRAGVIAVRLGVPGVNAMPRTTCPKVAFITVLNSSLVT
jgi:hypothetical protein